MFGLGGLMCWLMGGCKQSQVKETVLKEHGSFLNLTDASEPLPGKTNKLFKRYSKCAKKCFFHIHSK